MRRLFRNLIFDRTCRCCTYQTRTPESDAPCPVCGWIADPDFENYEAEELLSPRNGVSAQHARMNYLNLGAAKPELADRVRGPTPDEYGENDFTLEEARSRRGYGWLVSAMDDAFGFLVTDFGYRAGPVFLHFRGSGLLYGKGPCGVRLEYGDDITRDAVCTLLSPPPEQPDWPVETLVWEMLAAREPETEWFAPPRQQHLTKPQVAQVFGLWADGLRRLAPDVLRDCRVADLSRSADILDRA
jgi:hypothetical protein